MFVFVFSKIEIKLILKIRYLEYDEFNKFWFFFIFFKMLFIVWKFGFKSSVLKLSVGVFYVLMIWLFVIDYILVLVCFV